MTSKYCTSAAFIYVIRLFHKKQWFFFKQI